MKYIAVLFVALFLALGNSFASETLNAELAKQSGISEAQAKKQVKEVFLALSTELQRGNEVAVRNFGKFYLSERKARKGRNPGTGEAVDIPAKRYPKFRSSENLKKALNSATYKSRD